MKKYGKALAAACLCLAIFGGSAGVSGAYLWKNVNELNNVITPGSVEIKLGEPSWKAENGKNLTARETVAKDPMVTNTGKNNAWVFLQVDIPIRYISLVDGETKRKTEAASQELFLFAAQEGWTLVSKTADADAAHYVYGYDTLLKPGKTTVPLFTQLTFVNVLEGELNEEEKLAVPIRAVAIQGKEEETGEQIAEIYRVYLSQEAADEAAGESEDDGPEKPEGKEESGHETEAAE